MAEDTLTFSFPGKRSGHHPGMETVLLATAAVGGVLGTAGALWNGVQIARLAGRRARIHDAGRRQRPGLAPGTLSPPARGRRPGEAHAEPAAGQPPSRWTVDGENAGRQTATYSAPPGSGLL